MPRNPIEVLWMQQNCRLLRSMLSILWRNTAWSTQKNTSSPEAVRMTNLIMKKKVSLYEMHSISIFLQVFNCIVSCIAFPEGLRCTILRLAFTSIAAWKISDFFPRTLYYYVAVLVFISFFNSQNVFYVNCTALPAKSGKIREMFAPFTFNCKF